MTECGTATSDGNAIQVLQGEAIIKGGSIDGVLFNAKGKIELHGCVDYDEETNKIAGVLLDGSNIDAVYDGNGSPSIIYDPKACPQETSSSTPQNGERVSMDVARIIHIGVVLCSVVVLARH